MFVSLVHSAKAVLTEEKKKRRVVPEDLVQPVLFSNPSFDAIYKLLLRIYVEKTFISKIYMIIMMFQPTKFCVGNLGCLHCSLQHLHCVGRKWMRFSSLLS